MTNWADRFEHGFSAVAAFEHAVPHAVVSQVLRPEMAAFMPTDRIVTRCHADKLCCVDTATFIVDDSPLGPADIEYLAAFPYLVGLTLEEKSIDADILTLAATLTHLQNLNVSGRNDIDSSGFAEIAKLTRLQYLDLSDRSVNAQDSLRSRS